MVRTEQEPPITDQEVDSMLYANVHGVNDALARYDFPLSNSSSISEYAE